jgi:hypothetical protein
VFQIGSHFLPGTASDWATPTYASCSMRMTVVLNKTQPSLLGWGLTNFLARLVLNHNPPNLCLHSIWDYRREPLCLTCDIPFQLHRFSHEGGLLGSWGNLSGGSYPLVNTRQPSKTGSGGTWITALVTVIATWITNKRNTPVANWPWVLWGRLHPHIRTQ